MKTIPGRERLVTSWQVTVISETNYGYHASANKMSFTPKRITEMTVTFTVEKRAFLSGRLFHLSRFL
jgi:hypothetical protein